MAQSNLARVFHMQPRDLNLYRASLEASRDELEAVADSGAEAADTVELDQQRVGRVSRMDAMQQQAMGKESQRRRKLELRRIAAALTRLDDDEFGYCLRCEQDIAQERLRVDPAATLCIDCARRAE